MASLPPIESDTAGPDTRRGASLWPLLRLLRPHHWVKGVFIVLPVPFAVAAGARLHPLDFAAGLLGFSLLASAVYVFNDLRDLEADRRSPRKRHRPLASGAVSSSAAWGAGLACLVGAAALAASTGLPSAWALFAAYAGLNAAYSLGAKHVPLVDVFLLASGFVIRVLVGCALLQVPPSSWLLLCSSALALFLAFAKRRGDLLEGVGPDHRPSLAGYSVPYLDACISLCAGIALVGYALYCAEAEVLAPGREMASVPFVAFGLLDYLRLAYLRGDGASPVEMALTQRSLQAAGLLWGVAVVWSLGMV